MAARTTGNLKTKYANWLSKLHESAAPRPPDREAPFPVNSDWPPLPLIFVSIASKRLSAHVSGLESTLAGTSISVDSKRTYVALKLCKMPFFSLCIRFQFRDLLRLLSQSSIMRGNETSADRRCSRWRGERAYCSFGNE